MTTIRCPFCNGGTYQIDWQSICKDCFRRWETEFTDLLREEFNGNYKGVLNGKKSKGQKETKA